MTAAGAGRAIRLVHVLDLPPVTAHRRAPVRPVDLAALVVFCEARLPQLHARPGAEEPRLTAKTGHSFTL